MVFATDPATHLRGDKIRAARVARTGLDYEMQTPPHTPPRLKFPLHNEDEYPAYILFQPVITTPPNLGGGASGAIGEMIKFISDTTYTAATGNAVPADPAQPAEGPGTLANAGERDIPPAEFKAQSILTNEKKTNSRSSCKMYMPSSIVFQDGVSYSTADLGFVGGAASAGMSNGQGMIESLASGGFQSLGNLYDALKGSVSQDAARLGATRLAGAAGKNGAIDGAVRGTLRTSPVANMTMLFDKPQLRTFSFSFKMQPVSEREARMVARIVKFFRTELYPDAFNTDTLGGISVPFGYRFPNEIKISLHYGKGDNSGKNFIKFKPCYLTNFQATFNAPSAAFFKGGHFQETTISMTLRENELLNKKDIQDGF
jgi:hypothetical protein